ncbi:MAG: hypothetical protein ABEJ82_01740 [Haloplanus sp.]
MSLKERRNAASADSPRVPTYLAEWVCQDCDYAERRATTGVTGNVTRCPECGGYLVLPRDAMSP